MTGSKLIISGLMFGGGQRVVLDLARWPGSKEFEMEVVLLGNRTGYFDSIDVQTIEYDGRYNRPVTLFCAANRLRKLLRHDQPHTIHTHGWDADVVGWLASRGLKVKQIVHLHVTSDWLGSGRLRHVARRWLTRRMLATRDVMAVAVSEAVRAHWTSCLGVGSAKIIVIHNGVDVSRYTPTHDTRFEAGDPVIGVAARLAAMKGIEYLLDAVKTLERRGLPFRLDIAGEGELRNTLEERVARAGIGKQVRFLGHVDEMSGFYRKLDVFVFPSISPEGLPLSVLEAMATGIPVVATTVAGAPEAVRDGTDGFLVPPRDPGALAEKLELLLGNETLRRSLGVNARERVVEAFSLERFANEVLALYR